MSTRTEQLTRARRLVEGDGACEGDITTVLARMDALLAPMEARGDARRFFLATYRRTTAAVADALQEGVFVDEAWVERWDVVFAGLYLDAIDDAERGDVPPGPWATAFAAASGHRLPPLRHVLLGMNAHINFDLPQALLAMTSDDDLGDAAVLATRRTDHERIDAILASRVDAEDRELAQVEEPGDRTWLDRALRPCNQAATRRFMREARRKVWHNAMVLGAARRAGVERLADALDDLERRSQQRVADLCRPGQVLLELAVRGFGVEMPARTARPGA